MPDTAFAAAVASAVRSGRLNVENTWVSRRRGYFYMAVNKAASSKIKMVLHRLEGFALPADPFDVHARDRADTPFVDRLSAFGDAEAAAILKGPGWLRFGFVRNPYVRLWSAYKSKIADLASPYIGVRASIWRTAGARRAPAAAPPFEAFVRYVAQLPDAERDGHWRSQTGALCLDLVHYDVLGRVETFEADLARILRRLAAPESLLTGLDTPIGASTETLGAKPYDADLARRVYEAFEADFETLGYARSSWRELS